MRAWLAVLLLAAGAGFSSGPAGAAPFIVRLGLDRLVLDAPAGFADTLEFSSPRLTDIAESLTDASNRVLLFALTDADVRRFTVGDQLELRRYMIVATPRVSERGRMGTDDLAAIVQNVKRALGEAPAAGDFTKYLQTRTAGHAHLLLLLRDEPQVVSVMQGTMLPRPEGREYRDLPPVFRLSTTAMLLIAGKAVYLSIFSAYESPADVTWIRSVTERWIEDLQRLNR